jgi:hypothetical protein
MDGAVIPNKHEGEYDGEFRRGVEGARAGAGSAESSYPSYWGLRRTDWFWYPSETEAAETDAFHGRAAKNSRRTTGAVGQG